MRAVSDDRRARNRFRIGVKVGVPKEISTHNFRAAMCGAAPAM